MPAKQVIEASSGDPVLITEAGIGNSPGYTGLDIRRMATAGVQQQGVIGENAYKAKERGAGANMSVDIAQVADGGYAAVKGTSKNSQGLYVVPPHKETANITVEASDATNPRIDAVCLRIYDNVEDSSGKNTAELEYLKGTATSGATLENLNGKPATPANAMILAYILVPAKATSVKAAEIQDERLPARIGAGPYKFVTKTITKAEFEAGVELNPTNPVLLNGIAAEGATTWEIGGVQTGQNTLNNVIIPPGAKLKGKISIAAATIGWQVL